MEANLPRWS